MPWRTYRQAGFSPALQTGGPWAESHHGAGRAGVTSGRQGLVFPRSSLLSALVSRKVSAVSFLLNLKAPRERSESKQRCSSCRFLQKESTPAQVFYDRIGSLCIAFNISPLIPAATNSAALRPCPNPFPTPVTAPSSLLLLGLVRDCCHIIKSCPHWLDPLLPSV